MNNSEIKTFTAQILSNIDGSVIHTETFTAASVADVDAAQARLESFDHPWRIIAVASVPQIDLSTPDRMEAFMRDFNRR